MVANEVLSPGDHVVLVDDKGHRRLVKLRSGGQLHSHAGVIAHDQIIGNTEGFVLLSSSGRRFMVFRPTLSDIVLRMPRGAQIIYPKDLAQILLVCDIFPGAKVVESGVGSGALSMAMLRAGATVTGYEVREDFANIARRNVEEFLGTNVPYEVKLRDIRDGIDESNMDRMVLDLPEPWSVVELAEAALHPGGILLCYLPTINQTAQLRGRLKTSKFVLTETTELLLRSWHIDERSVRPDHRMVAHTGFITHARLIG
ncbi:MAG: tRNA (adenine-N1)-methyltransferase [Actinobacteria bacterium]|jgi:tRNA (adenine57-N1/adenine58-N1)-methyltransferase|nr:tRNA (adenine-N1)-methyltransferase [Actinomycetota bacterium]MCL6094248.1 tRNA (adenine-N1)-methyltransferase [Actinomycetota bacterium]